MVVLAAFSFLAGVITILSPCILPMLPIILASGINEGRRRPLGVIAGFVVSFTVFTLTLQALVIATGLDPDVLRSLAVVILILFGVSMLVPALRGAFQKLVGRIGNAASRPRNVGIQRRREGFWGGVPVGMSLGLVWTPCVGPIMASVITLAATQAVDAGAIVLALAYSLGTAVPMFAIMKGGRALVTKFPKLQERGERIQQVFGGVTIGIALLIQFNVDRQIQTAILDALPGYGAAVTALEDIEPVRAALDERRSVLAPPAPEGVFRQPATGAQPRNVSRSFGAMPDLVASGPWLGSRELASEDLRGRVVLIDFWTYSCINCQRTLPHIRRWHETYGPKGLVVIGVHAPEFAFEREEENVRLAMEQLGVTWPVVLDNSFSQWNAYQNRFWPAKYLVDAEGNVRYFHFGEGAYEDTEMAIQALLYEAGGDVPTVVKRVETENHAQTPETYLGAARANSHNLSGGFVAGGAGDYLLVEDLEPNTWSLGGTWIVRSQYITPVGGSGNLLLRYNAAEVFLVIELPPGEAQPGSPAPAARLRILVERVDAGETWNYQRSVEITNDGTYKLHSWNAGEGTLRLTVPQGARLYAFTFG